MKKNIRSVEERKLIASRLKDLLTEKNIKPIQFCKEIGIEYNKLKSYYVGRSEPNIHILKTIEDKFLINSEYLLSGDGEKWLNKSKESTSNVTDVENVFNIKMVDLSSLSTEQIQKILEERKRHENRMSEILQEI